MAGRSIILFGARSPVVVEYEEACRLAGVRILAAVSLGGAARLIDPSLAVAPEALDDEQRATPFIACAFAPARRRDLAGLAAGMGLMPAAALCHPQAVVAASARVREGAFLNAGAIVGALSIIGAGCLVNRAASIGHHTIIGDFTSIGPGATLASNIRIGENCVIGAGATLLPNIEIGAGSVVAAGSVVRKPVGAGMLAAGHPARVLRLPPARRSRDEDE